MVRWSDGQMVGVKENVVMENQKENLKENLKENHFK
jgi:hypothetical protein